MKDKVGIGMIGTGFGRKTQIPAFLACDGAFIASVSSGNIENARATADGSGASHYTDDWRETVARDDVDLVCITVPPGLHHEMTAAAVAAGKHILCEKPMAMDSAEAEAMVDAARGAGRLALIDHELRFQPGRRLAYKMLRDGVIGKVRHSTAVFQAPHRGDPKIAWNWWSDEKAGGGALGAIGSHIVDSFNWFLGTEISDIFCQLQTQIKERRDASGDMREVTSDDETNMLLRFADSDLTSDATGVVMLSMTKGPDYKHRMEFHGDGGAMRVDHFGEVFLAKTGEREFTPIEVDLGKQIPGVMDNGFPRAFMSFAPVLVDAVRNGQSEIENAATFADGLRVQRVLDAARVSNASGKRVSL